ncbi:methylated-DNA--[protein]-cysteine S-methyltransferase [Piscinibacter sp.]|uniref:methylated-DNA--[protein]-cysteine S-methyltransferase n=1 Tax=Piscinibacter sp. TaxID=1903157 RepID=UPI002B975124|nr:methylated-DNA--[protein]-cysteine S-methyltransferase [Albitalea sp.]HUG26559.1 methylated-DNA--[protein]-cysteine S-methyltransferase [Albitalea sp.]
MSFAVRSVHAACTAQATFASPLGAMLLARTAGGLAGVWFDGQKDHPGVLAAPQHPHDALLAEAAAQLADYFAGRRRVFDLLLDLHGTGFQRSVWQALLGIGAGRTRSYGEIARDLGSPNARRAVGAAVGKNPVSVIVPCHRVIGSGGALTGYAGGMARKQALLTLEGVPL